MAGLSNDDFRKIMMTPRPGAVPAAATAVPKSGEKSEPKEKKKKKWFKQKKNEEDDEDKPKYRDRAAERRSGVDVEYVDASTGITGMKGLSDDEAPEQLDTSADPEAQPKLQLSAAIKKAKPTSAHSDGNTAETTAASATPGKPSLKTALVQPKTDLGRAVYEQWNSNVAKRNALFPSAAKIKETGTASNAPLQSELILPRRKLLRFHTDPNSPFELPEVVVLSKHELQEDNTRMLKLNDSVMENLAKVMSYMGTKKKETKKADKQKLKEQHADSILRITPLPKPTSTTLPKSSLASPTKEGTPKKGVSFAMPPELGKEGVGESEKKEGDTAAAWSASAQPPKPSKPVMTEAPDDDDIFAGVGAFVPSVPLPKGSAAAAVSSATSFKAPQSLPKKTGGSYFGASAEKSFTLEDLKKSGPQIKLKAEALKQLKEEEAAANQAEDALESSVLSSQVKPIAPMTESTATAEAPLSREERQRRIDAEFEATVSARPAAAEADMEVEAPPPAATEENGYPNTDDAYPNTDNAYPNTDDAYPNTDDAYPNTDSQFNGSGVPSAPPKKPAAPTFAVVVETPLTDLEKRARGLTSVFRRDDSKARVAHTNKMKPEEKQATHVPDSYAECYPGAFETTFEAYEESDEEDLSKMDPGAAGAKKRLKRWDFETEEQWADYNQKREALPKAAFQFGVKASDGRKTRRQKASDAKEGAGEGNNKGKDRKKKDTKLNQELKKISGMMDDMKQNPNKRPKKGDED